jgi:hypothetical protein
VRPGFGSQAAIFDISLAPNQDRQRKSAVSKYQQGMNMSANSNSAAKEFENDCKLRWEHHCRARRISTMPIQRDLRIIDELVAHAQKELWEIGPNDLESWCFDLAVRRGFATSTIRSYQLVVCRFFA